MHSGEISIPVLFCTLCCCLADSIANGAISDAKMMAISRVGILGYIPDADFPFAIDSFSGSEDGYFNHG